MTSFEFVFGLISVITSLALTQMLSGFVALYRRADRVRLSWRHACWTATAFMVLIGNWAAFWHSRNIQSWGALDVLIPLVFTSVLYAFCDLVMPDKPAEGETTDLRKYHAREGKRYKLLQLVFAVLVMLAMARTATSVAQWAAMAKFAILAALIGVVALRAQRVWLDTATAAVLTVLAIIFMVSSLRVFST
jgi:hypothetical protein